MKKIHMVKSLAGHGRQNRVSRSQKLMRAEAQTISTGLFAKLPRREQLLLRRVMRECKGVAGGFVVNRVRNDTDLYWVVSGKLDVVRRHRDGHSVTLHSLGKGDLFGELALVTGERRSADVMMISDCKLWVLSRPVFLRERSKLPNFIFELLSLISRRLADTSRHLAERSLLDLPTRLLLQLGELAAEQNAVVATGESGPRVRVEIESQRVLALRLGVSRETVNRALHELEESHEIWRDGKLIWLKAHTKE